jgi:GTP-binding protein
VVLAVNKAEGMTDSPLLAEFHELGIGEPHPVSAAHGQGIRSLLEAALEDFPPEDDDAAPDDGPRAPDPPGRGRPAERRQEHADQRLAGRGAAGRLRPARHHARRHPRALRARRARFELIDTAGLRRKGKVFEAIEKFSVVKTLQAIADANVVLLLIDATQGVSDQDAHIAGYILDSGRAVVVASTSGMPPTLPAPDAERSIESRLAFLKFAPVLHISALKRQGLNAVWKAIAQAHASATRKMPTPVLTRLVHEAVEHQAPQARRGASAPSCAMPTRAA